MGGLVELAEEQCRSMDVSLFRKAYFHDDQWVSIQSYFVEWIEGGANRSTGSSDTTTQVWSEYEGTILSLWRSPLAGY